MAPTMNKKNAITATVILALLAALAWAFFPSEDPKLAEAKQMRDELFQKVDSMNPQQMRAGREAIREKTRDFTQSQRRAFGRGMRQFMMNKVDNLLALPPEQQTQELDKWIDRMEEMRKNHEPRGDRGANLTQAERDQRRKQRLDRTTPQMRAKMDRMKDLINQRREQRGLEPIEGGRGMFGPHHGPGGPRKGRRTAKS